MKQKQWLATTIVLVIVTILFVTMATMAFKVGPKYDYKEAVGGHIDNAASSPTPELVKENLILARTGMEDLGLTPDMYGRFMPWKQTPEWRMDYQYARLDAIIERCDEVIAWRDNQDLTSGQMADVYKEKMDAIKDLVEADDHWYGMDYIAYRAYMIENHQFLYLWALPLGVVVCLSTLGAYFNTMLLDGLSHRRTTGEERFDKDDRLMLLCVHGITWAIGLILTTIYMLNC